MKKKLKNKIFKNSIYGKFGTGTVSIDIESKFDWEKSLSFLSKMIRCKTCSTSSKLIGGVFYQTMYNHNCPECNGTGFREMDWVEKVIHGRIDKEK